MSNTLPLAAVAFGVFTAALAFVALWEVTPFFGGWPGPALLPLSGYYEAITFQALSAPRVEITADRLGRAEAATRAELKLSPMAVDAWLRLAYIESLKGPKLNAEGVEALQKSFLVAPLDPANCGDRDVLALNVWTDLPADLRRKVLMEIHTLWRPPVVAHPETLIDWRRRVQNPAGQFALLLSLGPDRAP
jgi:hypothetical protein